MKKLKFLTLFLTLFFALSIPFTSFAMDVTFTDPKTNNYPEEYQQIIKNAPEFDHFGGFFISADSQTDEIFAVGSGSAKFPYYSKHKVIIDNCHTVVYLTSNYGYMKKLDSTSNSWIDLGSITESNAVIYGSAWVRDNLSYVTQLLKLGSGSVYMGNVPVTKSWISFDPRDSSNNQVLNDEFMGFFPQLPVTILGPILAPIQMDPMKEILSLLSLLLPLLIGLIGLRKGCSFLQQKLQQA